jgi:predicted methyltransferase
MLDPSTGCSEVADPCSGYLTSRRRDWQSPFEEAFAVNRLSCIALAVFLGFGCATPHPSPSEIVSATDRTEGDRSKDSTRKPGEMLALFGVGPGMRVAEVGAGGGYTTELLARAVGPSGAVLAQDSPTWAGPGLEKAWKERLGRPVNGRVQHVMRDWEDPLPPEARNLDGVYIVMAYHDVVAEKHDPDRMNRAIFDALRSGGVYVVIDNSAKDASDPTVPERLHRIDEGQVRAQVEKAGFRLEKSAEFLRNANDDRTWAVDPPPTDARAHTQDRFALRFVKP